MRLSKYIALIVCGYMQVGLSACKDEGTPQKRRGAHSQISAPTTPPASQVPRTESKRGPLPWIDDDYPLARSKSRAQNKPMVIDFWAAWCHTCMAMKQGVLREPGLGPLANSFVWLSIDTEAEGNKRVLEAFPLTVWPTFLILSPRGDVIAKQIGASPLPVFYSFLERGLKQHAGPSQSAPTLAAAIEARRRADTQSAAAHYVLAAASYQKALELAPRSWSDRAQVINAAMESLHRSGNWQRCAQAGLGFVPTMSEERSSLTADFAFWTDDCFKRSGQTSPAQLKSTLASMIRETLEAESADLSVDDTSEAMRTLRVFYSDLNLEAEAQATAERQRKLLDGIVSEAASKLEEMTYAYHRVDVYTFLNRGQDLVPWLEMLTNALPDQYDPPYRLAGLLHELGHDDEASASARVALRRARGPRRANINRLLASIYKSQAKLVEAVEAQRSALKILTAAPVNVRRQADIQKTKETLAELQALKHANGTPKKN